MSDKLPLESPLVVLCPDEPRETLGWTVREYNGSEVYRFDVLNQVLEVPLTGKDDIKPGMALAVPGLMGGYHKMTVSDDCTGANNENLYASLEFNSDDRECWTCTGLINLKGVEKLSLKGL